nr:hypothetical protein CcurKRNrm2_p085 [Cryptomonas curvata]
MVPINHFKICFQNYNNKIYLATFTKNQKNKKPRISNIMNIEFSKNFNFIKPYRAISVDRKLKGFFSAKSDMIIFSKFIEGNFDNQSQFLSFFKVDQNISEFPRLEHIHCTIEKIGKTSDGKIFLIAVYYFPGIELKFFRIRYYTLYPCEFSSRINPLIAMEIYRIIPEEIKEKKILEIIQENYQKEKLYVAIKFNHCTVFWKKGEMKNDKKKRHFLFKGHLHEGGCSIFSAVSKYFLHINDDLILTDKVLLVNDRGFDEELFLIYGNNKEIFFQLDKTKKGWWADWVFL